jgi:MFS family permease
VLAQGKILSARLIALSCRCPHVSNQRRDRIIDDRSRRGPGACIRHFRNAHIPGKTKTQWIEIARGFSALAAGLLLLPMTTASGAVVPSISRRNLVRGPLIWAALACLPAGVLVLFLPSPAWLYLTVLVTILLGFAIGAASSNQLALYRQADPEELGTASGLMRSFGSPIAESSSSQPS